MFGSRLFWKLYLGYVVLVLLTAAVVGVLVDRSVRGHALDELELELERSVAVLRELGSGLSLD
ncbi:MAG: hypothetical protein HKN12_05595, partial [Gemmatimonadetes bacterium]|nr:hypothetical protein [Gemmatimonadota bacterium]